jgi:hypothetical protein
MTLSDVFTVIRRALRRRCAAQRARRFRAGRERGLDGISDAELGAMTRELAAGPEMQEAIREARELRRAG